ncbi:Uncharacterised protein [Mycobacteroides abscessus subsp. abscessus]|nr:Uncharacterised protein [Mycobacteroides abscessus subsp. abscessus]
MVAQDARMPSAATSSAVSNARAGMTMFMNTPRTVNEPVSRMPG